MAHLFKFMLFAKIRFKCVLDFIAANTAYNVFALLIWLKGFGRCSNDYKCMQKIRFDTTWPKKIITLPVGKSLGKDKQ